MKQRIAELLSISITMAAICPTSMADILATDTIEVIPGCAPQQQLIVTPGASVPSLTGHSIRHISLYRKSATGLSPLTFQIDPRDKDDRYLIRSKANSDAESGEQTLDENDELVFMAADLGERLGSSAGLARQHPLIELEINNPASGKPGWIYAVISDVENGPAAANHIRYDPDTDSVQTGLYRIGFSESVPFLIESLSWKLTGRQHWSPDVIDTMKIRHRGKLFGFMPFQRTGADYSSRLVAFKKGPLRVIRRTENKVRVVWNMKTPALYVDYVLTPDGFVMDTIIDIPFKIGLLFSDLDTLTTVDWNSDPALPPVYISYPGHQATLTVDGNMSADKQAFNQSNATRFLINSTLATIQVEMEIEDDFPIRPWLYLNDAIDELDPPERISGQFGNVGFRTTGWENIDTKLHHLKFTVCIQAGTNEQLIR